MSLIQNYLKLDLFEKCLRAGEKRIYLYGNIGDLSIYFFITHDIFRNNYLFVTYRLYEHT